MKWEGYNDKAERVVRKLFGVKGLTYLVSILMLGLLVGASAKWHG